jgi:hypothetical protein
MICRYPNHVINLNHINRVAQLNCENYYGKRNNVVLMWSEPIFKILISKIFGPRQAAQQLTVNRLKRNSSPLT